MNIADLLISMVLDEGKIRHLAIPDFDDTVSVNPFEAGVNPRVAKRALGFTGGTFYPKGHFIPDFAKAGVRNSLDYTYGPTRSPNHHMNAVVRHILPTLGSMLGDTRTKGYSDIKGTGFYKKTEPLSPRHAEIFKEYDRHLTDLADHFINRFNNRKKNNRIYGGKMSDLIDRADQYDAEADLRHDTVDHRGHGLDVSQFGEILATHLSPKANISRMALHPRDRGLNDDHTVDQLKARLDRFFRGKKIFNNDIEDSRSPVPEEHYDRILAASKKISIPKGRFQGRRGTKKRMVGPRSTGSGDALQATGPFSKARHYEVKKHLRYLEPKLP